MKNQPIENDDMPDEIDFSGGSRGLHHIPPQAKVFLPASIERSVWEYFSGKAEQKGMGLSELLTEVLKRDTNDHQSRTSNLKRLLQSKEDWQLQYYLVLFFDLLGLRAQLRQLTALPTDEEAERQVISVLRATVGRVIKLRVGFESFFEAISTETELSRDLETSQRELLRQHTQAKMMSIGFSDSFLVFVPLSTTDENCTQINGVRRSLLAAGSIMTIALSEGIALRGGIDVGLGMELLEGEIYGPCLERAYYLETQQADYPRISVGDELLQYLSGVEAQRPMTTFGKCAVAGARQCSSLVFEDWDGTHALDYLGTGLREAIGASLFSPLIPKAIIFAESEKQKWASAGDTKLAQRFDRLNSYLTSRADLWSH